MITDDMKETDDWGPLNGLPGNPIMWVLIASELIVFGAIFVGFTTMRLSEPIQFLESQNQLDRLAGGLNTMVLVTSGFLAALAVHFQIKEDGTKARVLLFAASLLGMVFLGIKVIEYADKFAAGITPDTNNFFMFYYLTTGFHAMHVIFGIILLFIVGWKNNVENIVTGTAFWHMVDLIWVLLFPIIYLMR